MLVAAAVGGAVKSDSPLLNIGRRLEAMGGTARNALASISERAQQARSAEKHRVHGAPDLDSVTQLHDLLAALSEREEAKLELQLTEIYVGFYELEYNPLGADACVSTGRTGSESHLHGHVQPQAASAFELRHRYREYDQFTKEIEAYDAQTLVEERELAEWTNGCRVTLLRRHLDEAEDTIKEQRREIDKLEEEAGTASDEYRHLYRHACGPLEDEIESLREELLVSRAGEAALRRVIHDNVMAMRQP